MTSPLRLRGYVVERLLGTGASSDVWQARAQSSGARVALKRIRIDSEEQRSRARSEAALLAALDHPNLVRLHALVEMDDALVLVLDLAEGGTLGALLAVRGRLTPGEVITAVAPVAAALDYLHDAGVVHGDVSAANILLTADGVPLLADVGVARLTGDRTEVRATAAYVDPLVAAGCVPGPQSDVFMLAGVALHALTGTPPWPDADESDALAHAAGGTLDDVSERLTAAGVPEQMSAVVGRALAVDPQRRGTAADFALELAHSGTAVAVELTARAPMLDVAGAWTGPRHAARPSFDRPAAPPPTGLVARARPVIPRPPQRRSRHARFAGLAAVLAALVVVLAGVAWSKAGTGAPHPAHPPTPQQQVETSRPTSGPRTPPPHSARGSLIARLDRLDAVRSRAFATRDPTLLRRVYLPGGLLRADVGLLARLVPVGCRLLGVRTRYTALDVHRHGSRSTVSALATLGASRLICGRQLRGRAAGARSRLRIVLVRTAAGTRIAHERVASRSGGAD